MADRISLRSKILAAAVTQRDKPPWPRLSRAELDQISDPCGWREPVYAWLLANHGAVVRARQHRNGWNRMHWAEIARIMDMDGVKGSRGEPPNANSVRRVWARVCRDKEDRAAGTAADNR
jgi:hypothetical protein